MPAIPRRESSAIYERLLRGEATSAEYVAALRTEAQDVTADVKSRIIGRFDAIAADRDRWHILFNRLEAAISHHKRDCEANDVPDTHDEALWAARDRVLRDAAKTNASRSTTA